MYEYIEGTLQTVLPEAAIVDVGGIGYRLLITKTDGCRLVQRGQKVKLFVELIIREDAHTLFGFSSAEDREFFRLLQQVSGIGPKLALNILSHTTGSALAETIFRKDIRALVEVPGIGKKLAERLIVELHERIAELVAGGTVVATPRTSVATEAIRALETLGFSTVEARNAVATAQQENPNSKTVEALVQEALKKR